MLPGEHPLEIGLRFVRQNNEAVGILWWWLFFLLLSLLRTRVGHHNRRNLYISILLYRFVSIG